MAAGTPLAGKSADLNPSPSSAPTAAVVEQIHTNADTDIRTASIHHTLGPSNTQASPGDHTHDGGTSSLLLSGLTITGSRGGNVALVSVIAALVRLGVVDQSSA